MVTSSGAKAMDLSTSLDLLDKIASGRDRGSSNPFGGDPVKPMDVSASGGEGYKNPQKTDAFSKSLKGDSKEATQKLKWKAPNTSVATSGSPQ